MNTKQLKKQLITRIIRAQNTYAKDSQLVQQLSAKLEQLPVATLTQLETIAQMIAIDGRIEARKIATAEQIPTTLIPARRADRERAILDAEARLNNCDRDTNAKERAEAAASLSALRES